MITLGIFFMSSQKIEHFSGRLATQAYLVGDFSPLKLPLFLPAISAGFPSPCDPYLEDDLDLNSHLIKHPQATFLTSVEGDSMVGAGIHSGDLLIVDRSLTVRSGQVVIAAIDGELTVKRLIKGPKQVYLQAANPNYPPTPILEETECTIWGVVTHAIHTVK
jgi:DNA polymerase V